MKGKQKKQMESLLPEEMSELNALLSETIALQKLNRSYSTSTKRKTVETHIKTSKNSDIPHKMLTKLKRKGLADLEYMVGLGIPLIGAYSTGAMIAKQEPENFTSDIAEITALMKGKGNKQGKAKGTLINRFYFIPEVVGLICLDIDIKNGKDGIKEFYSFCERIGKPRHLLPSYLQDIPHSFPCYVSTPSGGFHLYFSYFGAKLQNKPLAPEIPCVEIKHGKPGLTSPGSDKDGKPYILHGNIEDAPSFPAFILVAIEPPKQKQLAYIQHDKKIEASEKPSWEKIRQWTEKDGHGIAGRDEYAFSLALHAKTHKWEYVETKTAITAMTWNFDISFTQEQLVKCIDSAYSRRAA